ncbi:MAG: mechanosensitive ion channel family protein [Pirellulaceae bacterium]|nr:mechanosensitive ion channel family protein [Pirellulaceae bacterium]
MSVVVGRSKQDWDEPSTGNESKHEAASDGMALRPMDIHVAFGDPLFSLDADHGDDRLCFGCYADVIDGVISRRRDRWTSESLNCGKGRPGPGAGQDRRQFGLTQLALTVVGGTGLIGLAVGIAFREITENFLASIFLSLQRPFETGDMIEVTGVTGYVQQLNVRTTILMTLDGNLVQIPNASIYKNNLRNFTTNANRREDFVVGIGYNDSITEAQEIARKVLVDHPAVLNDPEPSVLADSLGTSTLNLRVYFWLNGREHSWLKVRSSVTRLVKRALQQHGISMPDEARKVIFPQGIPVITLDRKSREPQDTMVRKPLPGEPPHEELSAVSTKAEAGLYSDASVIKEQARQVQPAIDGENLLKVSSVTAASGKKGANPSANGNESAN